jgi:hypothetical protein
VTVLVLPVLGPTEFPNTTRGSWSLLRPSADEPVSMLITLDHGDEMTEALLSRVERFIGDFEHFDNIARTSIREDYARAGSSTVRDYLTDHLVRFGPAERLKCFGTDDVNAVGVEQLLSGLGIVEVALFPDAGGEEAVAMFDYILGSGITDYMLTIRFNDRDEPSEVECES